MRSDPADFPNPTRFRYLATVVVACCISAGWAPRTAAQQDGIAVEQFQDAFPGADRFGPKSGDPPVYQAFGPKAGDDEALLGFLFLTSDIPPEVYGYSAPIDVLVGMDLEGTLTGIAVLGYRESLRRSRGDFLNRGSFLGQFSGKNVADRFRLRDDVDGISGASITVDAMARGIRNSARRVAASYLNRDAPDAAPVYIATIDERELSNLLWAEILDRGLAVQVVIPEGSVRIDMSMMYLRDHAIGAMLVGTEFFEDALNALGPPEPERHLMIMALSGEDSFFFRASALHFVQASDTISVPTEGVEMTPILREGKLQGEVRRTGLVAVDAALDVSRPFEVVLDFSPRGGTSSAMYTVSPPQSGVFAALDPESALDAESPSGAVPAPALAPPQSRADSAPDAVAPEQIVPSPTVGDGGGSTARETDFQALLDEESAEESESALGRVLARTSWFRVGMFAALLSLAFAAFTLKREALRWVTLAATLGLLGFYDGGFLSVSHIMAGISVGPSVYLTDIPLLLMIAFTVVTTLLWGRVFCGFLCPFGALQDFLERLVPSRFRRELPGPIHDRALYVKYVFLAIVLAPAIVGSGLSLFQFFEPFGTVFFWSRSLLLWSIAGGILAASAIVPRFYCRYACPLGAALAIGSLFSPFRIRRVEQCGVCKVCQQRCPTGAIRGPNIDFKECVRCNTCEVQLIEKNGVCAHDMEEIRHRLVRLPVVGTAPAD